MAVHFTGEEPKHVGCVIRTWEHNGAWDSDFYADVIIPETGEIETIMFDTTRFPSYGDAEADLTEENFKLYQKNAYPKEVEKEMKRQISLADCADVGKVVKVVKGRKIPHGTTGKVFWRKEVNYDPYGRWYKAVMRIGFKDDEGNVYWTNESNVEVVNPEQYIPTREQAEKNVKEAMSIVFDKYKKIYNWN